MSLAEQDTKPAMDATVAQPQGGIFGLDRKAMEEERLARAASRKRERSISPPTTSRKAPKVEQTELQETTITMNSGAMLKMFSSGVQQQQQDRKPATANRAINEMKKEHSPGKIKSEPQEATGIRPESLPSGSLKYPYGVIKKTWAFGHERTGNEVKIEEVLEASTLKTAVLSAFQWDTDWILPKLKTPLHGGKTKCIFIMHAKEDEERDKIREWASEAESFLRVCLPPMRGLVWCMHSKLMLLFHPDKLRIAIPTANLLNFDWGETGQMENTVWMIDLPRLPQGSRNSIDDLTFFGKELMHFIEKQGLDQNARDGLLAFGFTATKDMAFIHTIGGVHYRQQAERTGLLGLSRAIRELKLTASDLEIDFAASSIGQLNEKYLQDVYSSACGQDLIAQAASAKSKASADFFKKGAKKKSLAPDVNEKLRVYFPTEETVKASTAGAAGTICLQRSYFEAKTFPRDIFRDYKSTRPGLLSHNKIMCARGKGVGWVYVGSSNMSKSAWGELPKERNEKKITCRNWECGVLLPVARQTSVNVKQEVEGEDSETEDSDEEPEQAAMVEMEAFKGIIDLPFECPGETYNGREPWYFKEEH
ncbi:hypothetical protein M409DRAFT_28325 [Zasmidium cellare ATCC 36951]|uniref:PLD phosphodiesterase domain-containing protein n=1 Tax=Zasmidium cellare ATCC 36951 TaxID=1080233 RepID=A0A6A6C2E1_ZASCE|nr:uncharacterized protein M409DRAFT_28325 [Zasmidium cellare ATCC 36951]KAF2161287.1 hypothetical protein M409DRAFT_28325 [Zasmidium cellare ATCC 36951]